MARAFVVDFPCGVELMDVGYAAPSTAAFIGPGLVSFSIAFGPAKLAAYNTGVLAVP
jgi:hypothetical protein